MGKIRTITMGDLEAEEKARQKAEVKRSQKRLLKETKTPEKPENSEDQKISKLEKSDVSEAPELRVSESSESSEKRSKKKAVESEYRFPPGKKYLAAKSLVDSKKLYSVPDAIDLVKKASYSAFDGSVELVLNVTEKGIRGAVSLPHGTGKLVKVKIADDTLVTDLEKGGKIDFDILVAHPAMMGKLAKIAKLLGPRGLMPNPKTNTISENPQALVKLLSSSAQYKTEPDFPIIHTAIGKVSFETKKLEENFAALTKSIGKEKIKSAFLKATMGPSIKVLI